MCKTTADEFCGVRKISIMIIGERVTREQTQNTNWRRKIVLRETTENSSTENLSRSESFIFFILGGLARIFHLSLVVFYFSHEINHSINMMMQKIYFSIKPHTCEFYPNFISTLLCVVLNFLMFVKNKNNFAAPVTALIKRKREEIWISSSHVSDTSFVDPFTQLTTHDDWWSSREKLSWKIRLKSWINFPQHNFSLMSLKFQLELNFSTMMMIKI